MSELAVLENGEACAIVLPQHGAGLASFDLRTRAGRLPAFRPLTGEPRHEHDLALYLLLPFSNRIGGGGFAWNGRWYGVQPNVAGEGCPLHGDAWQNPWTVVEQSQTQVRLQFSSRQMPPFLYDAEIIWSLEGTSLCGALTLTHRGKNAMIYGGGFHPWFLRDPDTELQAHAEGWWSEDPLHLPTHWHALANDDSSSFSSSRPLPREFINAGYTGWDGRANVSWPGRGLALRIQADVPLNRYVVYSPGEEAKFFCFEPVSHDVNAHNASSPLGAGLMALSEGETLRLCARFTAIAL